MNMPLRSQGLLKGEPAQEWKRYEQKFVHLIKGRELVRSDTGNVFLTLPPDNADESSRH